MRGRIEVFYPGVAMSEVRNLALVPTAEELHDIIGGFIETVPYWNTIDIGPDNERRRVRCVAFCNEHGKGNGLMFNALANKYWKEAIAIDYGMRGTPGDDYLVGNIVVICGDDEFMAEL